MAKFETGSFFKNWYPALFYPWFLPVSKKKQKTVDSGGFAQYIINQWGRILFLRFFIEEFTA
jgi:hypothetical protein